MSEVLDSLGCRSYLDRTPEVVAASLALRRTQQARGDLRAVVLVGTGALGVALELARAILQPVAEVPIVRVASHDPFPFHADDLVVAASFAGDTPEVLEHLERASAVSSTITVLQSRGPAGAFGTGAAGVHVLDGAAPGPRFCALEVLCCALELLSDALGLAERPSTTALLEAFAATITDASAQDQAEQWARRIDRTMVLSIGSGQLGGALAQRLSSQIDEQAKTLSLPLSYPELAYSTIAGFGQGGDLTRQVFTAIELLTDAEDPSDRRRRQVVVDMIDENVAHRLTVAPQPGTVAHQVGEILARIDLLALALAAWVGIDPGPVPAIAEIKAAVARRDDGAA